MECVVRKAYLAKTFFSVLILVLSMTSCSQEPVVTDSSSSSLKNELVLNLGMDPSTMDPRQARDTSTFNVLNMLYEGLTRLDEMGKPVPGIAKEISVSEDKTIYTFHLRECNWSDGTPLTAHDFEYSWKTVLDPNFPSEYAHAFYVIKNAKAAALLEIPSEEIKAQAIDDHTFVVELEAPAPFFLQLAALPPFSPIQKRFDMEHPNWHENSKTEILSSGPFVLSSWKNHNEIVVRKNPHYYDAESVKLDGIRLVMVDESTELSMFEAGELDWAGSPISVIPADAIQALKDSELLHSAPALGTHFFRFNVEKAPFDNRKMRQAFSLAVDRKAIVEHVLQAGQIPAMGFLPESIRIQNEAYFEDNNLELAEKLFQEALEEMELKATELPPILLSYTMSDRHHKLAQAIQQQWKKAFKLDVQLDNMEGKVFLEKRRSGNYQMANGSWIGDYSDPINFLEIFQNKADSVNNTGWENDRYRELLLQAKMESDETLRMEYMHDAERILMEEMPVLPIFYYTFSYLKQNKVNGVHLSDLGHLNFRSAYIEAR
jgi:oligopeptide transport system substrate-binding protein